VQTVEVVHQSGAPSTAVRLTADGKVLSFSGDTEWTEALIPIASLILLVAISYYLFGDGGAFGPNQVALVVATMVAVFIASRRGHTLEAGVVHAAAAIQVGDFECGFLQRPAQ
jgi:hypothetical protein